MALVALASLVPLHILTSSLSLLGTAITSLEAALCYNPRRRGSKQKKSDERRYFSSAENM